MRDVFQDAADARIDSQNKGTVKGFTQKLPIKEMAQKMESPTFASANSVINDDPAVQQPKGKVDKTKNSQPTTGEKGEVALQNEKSHRDTVKSVFEYSHEARIPSGNTGQLKSRVQMTVPEQQALV